MTDETRGQRVKPLAPWRCGGVSILAVAIAVATVVLSDCWLRVSLEAAPAAQWGGSPGSVGGGSSALSVETALEQARMVAAGSLPAETFDRTLQRRGVRFAWNDIVRDRFAEAMVPAGVVASVRKACDLFEERELFYQASTRRLAEIWERYLNRFPQGPRAGEARVAAEDALRFAWLRSRPVIVEKSAAGFNKVHFALLHAWRDDTTVRVFLRATAQQAGTFRYHARESETSGTVGTDEFGAPLRLKRVVLANSHGDDRDPLAAADGETFYVELFLDGAAPTARSIRLFGLPYLRVQSIYSSSRGLRDKYLTAADWQIPLESGVAQSRTSATWLQAIFSRPPVQQWACTGSCPWDLGYFGSRSGRTAVVTSSAMHDLGVAFLGAVRLSGLPGVPAAERGKVLLAFAISNRAPEAQLLIPITNGRYLVQGSDDRGSLVALRWHSLVDERMVPVQETWLQAGKTTYVLLEARGVDPAASELVLRSRFLVASRADDRVSIR